MPSAAAPALLPLPLLLPRVANVTALPPRVANVTAVPLPTSTPALPLLFASRGFDLFSTELQTAAFPPPPAPPFYEWNR